MNISGRAGGGAKAFARAAGLLDRGAAEKAYTAAVLLAARGGDVAFQAAAGEATPASIFDVASLTKPLVASLFFVLAQQGKLSPGDRLADVLPVSSPDPAFGDITFAHLLAHTSGLPAWRPLHAEIRDAEAKEGRRLSGGAEGHDRAVAAILEMPLSFPPGTRCVYSDLGYILLGRAVEAAAFESLDRLLRREICEPLRMADTGYLPLATYSECETGRLVSTGFSQARGREKVGEVDDENAAAMGGVAGHAGVFSTAYDIFLFAREVLRARRGEGRVLTRPSAVAMTTRVQEPSGCERTLGFDTPSPESQAGRHFAEGSFGHLGFTGCSLWVDPGREATVVLLSNRVFDGEQNDGLKPLRPLVHDAVMEELIP
ncbi:MAG: serine hydrolase domain-containing protein [Deltaproteobacteria bacterium]